MKTIKMIRTLFPVIIGVLSVALWPADSLHASGPPVETTYEAVLVNVDVQSVTELPGGNVIQEAVLTWESTGDWEGTFIGLVRSVTQQNGVSTASGVFTFEGTVLGLEGTLDVHHVGTFKADGTFKGNNTILRGTGELEHVRGQGKNVVIASGVIEARFLLLHIAP